MNPQTPTASAALRFIFSSVLAFLGLELGAQMDCCFPLIDIESATTSCPGDGSDSDFSPTASACDGSTLDVAHFTEDLSDGWMQHAATTSMGMGPDGAIRLFGLSTLGYAPSDYFFESEPMTAERLPSGRVRVTGRVHNQWDDALAWDVHMVLHEAEAADVWLASDPSHALVVAYGCSVDTANLITYVLDPAHSHLTGAESLEGSFLQLSHMPHNQNRRYQLGQGGSSHNCGFGLGGWFAWDGVIHGESVLGMSGDLVVDLAEAASLTPGCGDPVAFSVATAFDATCGLGASEAVWVNWEDETAPELDLACPADSTIEGYPTSAIGSPAETGEVTLTVTEDCSAGLAEPTWSWTDIINESTDCATPTTVERLFTAEVVNGCGLMTTATCTQTFAYTEVEPIPGIEFPGDTAIACTDVAALELPPILDACGNELAVEIAEVVGPAIEVLESSSFEDFNDCSLDGFVNFGGSSAVELDGIEGTCGVQLAQYIGMLPNNFYRDAEPTGFGTYSVSARTNTVTADVLLRVFAGPGIVDPGLIFSIRPSGSDNPGVNVLGFGLQAATTAPPVMAEEWFDIDVVVAPGGVELWLDGEWFWSGPLPANLPESGHFKLAASGSASYDNMAFSPVASCPNDYTLTRTWTATDATGASLSGSQFLVITDTAAPVFEGEMSIDWPCDLNLPDPTVEVSDCGDFSLAVTDSMLTTGACSPAGDVWLRTFTAEDVCGNASTFEQVIHLVDTVAPALVSVDCAIADGDTLVACPDSPEWAAWASCTFDAGDNCGDADVLDDASSTSAPVAACSFSDPAPFAGGQDCDGYQPHAMRLFDLTGTPGGEFWSVMDGAATTLLDGRFTFSGTFWNQDLGPDAGGLTLEAHYGPGANWEIWSAGDGNPSYLYACPAVPDLHENWMYHVMDSAQLVGFGAFEGVNLTLQHQPANAYYGLQTGWGASSKNAENGFQAWFAFEGTLADQTLSGSGNFFGDLDCSGGWSWTRTLTAMDCSGNESSFAYTLDAPADCGEIPVPIDPATLEAPASDFATPMALSELAAPIEASLTLSPNPASGAARLSLTGFPAETIFNVQIFDARGGIVPPTFRGRTDGTGKASVPIAVPHLPAGTYRVECSTPQMKAGTNWLILY